MMTFRKISAASVGAQIAAYFTENTPDPDHDFRTDPGRKLDSGGRLTSYYTGRDGRAVWRPDLSPAVADALGVDHRDMPKRDELARLFEGKRGDTGEGWTEHERKVSAYDLTLAPHKSITLAAEFASTAAERAAFWHAIQCANDDTMRYVARELGWARKGKGGQDGADPGQVGWVSFHHETARPVLHAEDATSGTTHLVEGNVGADPHLHVHNALFNLVVTEDGRVGSLDTQRLHSRVHEFGAYFQAKLADQLRALGVETAYDEKEQAVVATAIPQEAVEVFSRRTSDVTRAAKDYARKQGHDWEAMPIEQKLRMLKAATLATRQQKNESDDDRQSWRDRATAIGWSHTTALGSVKQGRPPEEERIERAYAFAARHLAREFHTAGVVDHDKLRLYAARGLIGTGVANVLDIDKVVEQIETRGIDLRGERVALLLGFSGDKVRVTNTAQVRIEESLSTAAAGAARDRSNALSPDAVEAAIARSELRFDSEHGRSQLAAIRALGTGGALSLLTGVAGAGKTALLKPLVDAWQADGREVIGLATAWRQADALKEAGVNRTAALAPFLQQVDAGEITAGRKTVLVIDEISQVAPRQLLRLLELQQRTGLTIKAIGDREQAQSIEAGDTVELLSRVLPREETPHLLSTIRQRRERDREVAALFRGRELDPEELAEKGLGQGSRRTGGTQRRPAGNPDAASEFGIRAEHHLNEVREALTMKREDGTVMMVAGDHDQVLARIADHYLARRDALLASGAARGITISALTNQDVADISRVVRERLRARGEIASDERTIAAIDQRGESYDMEIATGDRVRLFNRVFGRADGSQRPQFLGSNGDIVEVLGHSDHGLLLRGREGETLEVGWDRLRDVKTGRIRLGFGHAMTIDAAQGITSDEHINALPRGVGKVTGFTAYVAESRARGTTWTMISDGATFEAVRSRRSMGDIAPITAEEMWEYVATSMATKPYKALGMDLQASAELERRRAAEALIRAGHLQESLAAEGRDRGREIRMRIQADKVREHIPRHIAALDAALAEAVRASPGRSAGEDHLRRIRIDAERARQDIAATMRRASPGPLPG